MSDNLSANRRIRTRFAPSPTGFLHIGGLRTALYSYAFAKSQGGKFVLRIEDTDRKRFVPGVTEKIYEMLKIFGITWDEGPLVGGSYEPYIQSERMASGIYKESAEKLVKEGHAYYCFCPKEKEDRENARPPASSLAGKVGREENKERKIELRDKCRELAKEEVEEKLKEGIVPAIRLRVPDKETISYHDFVIDKDISWETANIDDVMLLKSDGFPTYHLGVVVDDSLMKISHVIRGRDWLPSTPVHLLLYRYLGFSMPEFGHLTDILDPEGGKLSKRKGSVSCEEFLSEGYLPEAILNFIMLLGWAPKDNREQFTLGEFVENFQKGSLQIANPVFNRKKLDWFNGVYLRHKSDEELFQLIKPFAPEGADNDLIKKTIPLVRERMIKLSDYTPLAGSLFKKDNEVKLDEGIFGQNSLAYINGATISLQNLEKWDKLLIESALQELIKKNSWNTGDFFMSFRGSITGSKITPPITDVVQLLGKESTLARLKKAEEILKNK